MNKTEHEEVSLGTKPKDQGWELSLPSLGVQNRYLSAGRTAGILFCQWSGVSFGRGSAASRTSFRFSYLPREVQVVRRSPVSF